MDLHQRLALQIMSIPEPDPRFETGLVIAQNSSCEIVLTSASQGQLSDHAEPSSTAAQHVV